MLNQSPLNSVPLNTTASAVVTFAAAGVVSATAAPVSMFRRRGFSATGAAAVTAALQITRRRNLAAVATARVQSEGAAVVNRRFSAQASVRVTGVAQIAAVRTFAATGLAETIGTFDPGVVLVRGTATVTGVAQLQRRRNLATAVTATTQTAAATLVRFRGFRVAAAAAVSAAPTLPDITSGGVKRVNFGVVQIAAQVTVPPAAAVRTANFSAIAAAGVTATVALQRRRLVDAVGSATVGAAPVSLRVIKRLLPAPALARVTGSATFGLSRTLGPIFAACSVTAAPARFRLVPAALQASATASVTAVVAAPTRQRGFTAAGTATVVAAPADFRISPKLFAAPAFATVIAAPATLITISSFSAIAAFCRVVARAEFFTNIYDDEPDYRTFVVPPQDFSFVVPPQVFVAFISSDARSMITYAKQPGERLAYDFDFSVWFAELEGDDIEAASVSVVSATSPAGAVNVNTLVVQQPIRIGTPSTRVKVWIESGVSGARYKLTLVIDTEGGRRKEVEFYVRIKEL